MLQALTLLGQSARTNPCTRSQRLGQGKNWNVKTLEQQPGLVIQLVREVGAI